jgi:hemolysin III
MLETHTFNKKEEVANATTHGIGLLLSVIGSTILIVFSSLYGSTTHIVTFSIYGISMVILFTSSTLLHALPRGKAKDVFEVLDHSSIYLFIAGSYTPLTLIVVQGVLGWVIFGLVWGIAIFGIIFKYFFVKQYIFASTALYIVMGWLIIFAISDILTNVPTKGVILLVVGGLTYTIGSIFYVWRLFPFHHAVWHVFVLIGSIVHFLVVLLYVLPIQV